MSENTPHVPAEYERRASLTPIVDYGGPGSKLPGREAIQQAIKAGREAEEAEIASQPPTLFDEEFKPIFEIPKPSDSRAVLGSMAMNQAQRDEYSAKDPISVTDIYSAKRNDGTGRSIPSQRRQAEIDSADARASNWRAARLRANGRGPGA